MFKKIILVLGILLLTGAVLTVDAAGKHDKGPKGQKINATVTFDPVGPINVGDAFMVKGSGYVETVEDPFNPVHVGAATPGCCLAFNVSADENGEWSVLWIAGAPGVYQFTGFQGRQKSGKYDYYGFGRIEVLE